MNGALGGGTTGFRRTTGLRRNGRHAAATALLWLALPALTGCSGTGSRPAHALRPTGPPTSTTPPVPTTVPDPGTPVLAYRVSDIPGSGFASQDRVVALTFDDGPDPRFTPQVLAILANYRTTATFFMVGRQVVRYPDLVRRVAAAGHSVQGHTWNHVDLTGLPDDGYVGEIDRADDLLATLVGRPVRCVRPPRGRVDSRVVGLLGQRHLDTVVWNIDSRDWKKPGRDAISATVLAGLRPGAVILMHDGGGDRAQTVAALPTILEAVSAQGYQAVSLCK